MSAVQRLQQYGEELETSYRQFMQETELDPGQRSSDFPKRCCKITCDTLSGVALPIFLIISLGFIVNFAIHPGSVVQITSNFSLSVPLIIWSSLGLVTIVALGVQVARLVKFITPHKLTREMLHIGPQREVHQFETTYFQRIEYQTRDNIKLEGLWHFVNQNVPTVIVFHGNGCTKEDTIADWGQFYKERGYNVLLAEYRGYGTSEGVRATRNQEMDAYLDAEAAHTFVLSHRIDPKKEIAHGTSLGGAYASALGDFFNVPYVVLDVTFTSFTASAKNIMPKIGKPFVPIFTHSAYNSQKMPAILENAKPMKTDCFNNLKKIKRMEGRIFAIRAENDQLMAMGFAEQFIQAKYQTEEDQAAHLATIPGEHMKETIFDYETEFRKLISFLNSIAQEQLF